MKVDRTARLSLVIFVKDPVGGLIVVLILETLVLLALDREIVRTSAITSRVSLLARGEGLALFRWNKKEISIAEREQGGAQRFPSRLENERTIRSPS